MRKLFLIIYLVLLSSYAQSQTLHAIVFANTECPGDPRNPRDRGIGHSVSGDYYRMKIEMTTIASFIGYELKAHYFVGSQEQFCRQNLDKVIDELKCGAQDIVFFYYSGHGSRSANEKTDYPQMNLVVDPYRSNIPENTANYPIYNVMKRIEAKKPRLTIVIGDLCNSISNWVTPKSIPSDKSATKVEDAPIKFYKDLFLRVKGSLIAVSSKPEQTSAACEEGGAFTLGLIQVLQTMVSNGMEPSWSNLFEGSIRATEHITNGRQTPIYDTSNLHLITASDNSSIDNAALNDQNEENNGNLSCEEVNAPTLSITRDEVALTSLLTSIGDESISEEKRIDIASKALNILFESPNAIVKVVGRDGKTEVSTKTAKAYLDWLTVTTHLYKVVPIKGTINSNDKFSYLQIHEMYK